MSLVSYGASDDSDASDSEDGKVTTNQTQPQAQATVDKADTGDDYDNEPAMSGHISDDDDFQTVSSTSVTSSTTGGLINTVDRTQFVPLKDGSNDDVVNSTSVTSLEDLPAPQSKSSVVETEEEELEDEVKPKASEIANAPKPPGKKTKQPVKITIPSLDETPEEEESKSKKHIAASKVKSGLFSMLPAPVHSAKKELNRPLIPHTLSKRPTVSQTEAKSNSTGTKPLSGSSKSSSEVASTSDISSKRMTPFNALTGYDSDSDDDIDEKGSTTNFFSLSSSSDVKVGESTSSAAPKKLQSEEVSSSESDLKSSTQGVTNENSVDGTEVRSDSGNEAVEGEEEERITGPEPGAVNDAPLDFRSMNRLSSLSASSYSFLGPVGPAGSLPPSKAYTSYQSSYSVPSNSLYNMANAEVPSEMDDTEPEVVGDDDLKKFMSDKEFQRLQGKRKRGLEEAINFVDANVDDYVDPSEVSKHLTEETEYVSHKNKDNLPTAQQRRKKQITYLAYQAKERELELKNTWAANRMTKKQTQSKYGF